MVCGRSCHHFDAAACLHQLVIGKERNYVQHYMQILR